MFSRFPLFSEQVDRVYTTAKDQQKVICIFFKPACPQVEPVTPVCQDPEVEVTFTSYLAVLWIYYMCDISLCQTLDLNLFSTMNMISLKQADFQL